MRNLLFFLLMAFVTGAASAQDGPRRNITVPDIPGYHTLKGDFHMHTVFSDGLVWPTLRVIEAWQEGLDVIALTDHVEYQPFKSDVNNDRNRPHAIAEQKAAELGILLIRGGEITRKMPPGHSNALFLKDVNKLDTTNWQDAFAEAKSQGAFVFWNHPGWKAQQPDTTKWFDEHTRLLEQGMIQGIEIVNYMEYYPEAFAWALEKNLTILGNSDIHGSIYQEYDAKSGLKRPVTLVFARERSAEGVKSALKEGNTAVLFNGNLYGRQEWLKALFGACVGQEVNAAASGSEQHSIFLTNYSDIDFRLIPGKDAMKNHLIYPLDLPAHSTIALSVTPRQLGGPGKLSLPLGFTVDNMFVAPGKKLEVIVRF
ncbi:MAG: CehA/McbA family metallohydrolase [Bacteroidales bacterium]|nr:CehA/McbA family metallohydrolase [Bacteroidales bacterium]MBK9356553.1 CehA/McbA family metallohydrolase [Bacteroidales bacterium]